MDVRKYEELKNKVDKLQREHDRAEGTLAGLMARLKEEHDCDSLDEAKKKLEQQEAKLAKMEARYDEALEQFESEWGEQLEAV